MIGKKVFLLLCLLGLTFPAMGASFDCAKAQAPIEKIICSDDAISQLDSDLSTSYRAMRIGRSSDQDQRFVSAQKKWLKDVRNKCGDKDCLYSAYRARVKELGPFADDKITCAEMRKYPRQIFDGGIDLGSGHGSPIEVDYECPESLASLPFLEKILSLAEQIRAEGSYGVCTGTIIFAQWRYYRFSLAEAGFAPQHFKNPTTAEGSSAYFRQWSEESPGNFRLYKEFIAEFDRDVEKLAEHYQKVNKIAPVQSREIARNVLQSIQYRAAGSYPRDALSADTDLTDLVRDGKSTLADLNELLSRTENPVSKVETYLALKKALLLDRDLKFIQALAGKLSKTDLDSLSRAGEPLLSFGLNSPKAMAWLLALGTPVDAQNDFGKTALFYAIGSNKHEAVRLLLDNKANVNHAYKTANELRPAVNGYVDSCIYPSLEHTRRTPLMHAAQNSDVEMLKLLIERGAALDATDDLGFNALDYALMGKQNENEKFLISKGLSASQAKKVD